MDSSVSANSKDGKKRKKKTKVGVMNDSFELEEAASTTVRNKVSPFLNNMRDMQSKNNNAKSRALEAIVEAKKSVSRWKDFANRRRKKKKTSALVGMVDGSDTRANIGGLGLDDIHDDFVAGDQKLFGDKTAHKTMSSASNRALLQYFAKLGKSDKDNEVVDLDFIETLVNSGANINCTDKHGQSLLHEVASKWHTDVARFLIDFGADVNQSDNYGRTPLHVAAADNYPDMVMLLIECGADKEAKTTGEKQTPVHYAARNDASESLKALVKSNCRYKMVTDYKGRTPLHVAAELDRSETSRLLLDLEAPCGVTDDKGQSTISWMIGKMPPVALEAITQFHVKDRPNRKQYFYLNLLCPNTEKDPNFCTQMPLAMAIKYKQYDVLTQGVFITLIQQMWQKFARWRACFGLLFNFTYILLWTLYGVTTEYDNRHEYRFPTDWWRIVLIIAAVGFTLWQIIDEIREYWRSQKLHENQKKWREDEIKEDLKYCHPRWPEEKTFLETELQTLSESHTKYFSDAWNLFDWMCYALLVAVIGTHIADVANHTESVARAHIRLTAVVIIFLWVRLMKNIRAFALLGPFVVMVGAMVEDLLKFGFLYFEFYIPYLCAFWMIFGGTKYAENSEGLPNRAENLTVDGFEYFNSAMFTLWRMTLVDEYDYPNMKLVDSIMADLLVGTWLFLSAVLCLNLLIALFSDTFQRVYDNAKANALMQKAIMILSFWEGMSKESRMKFLNHINDTCAPMSKYYDDDMTETDDADLKKVTIQIKEELDNLMEKWHGQFGEEDDRSALEELQAENNSSKKEGLGAKMVTTQKFTSELENLRDEIHQGLLELQNQQKQMSNQFKREMKMVKSLLLDISGQGRPPGGQGPHGGHGSGGQGLEMVYRGYSSAGDGVMPIGDYDSAGSPGKGPETGKRKKKKRKSTLEEGSLLDLQLPGEYPRGMFARTPSEPVVEVSTQDFTIQQDTYGTNILPSSRSTTSHDPDPTA